MRSLPLFIVCCPVRAVVLRVGCCLLCCKSFSVVCRLMAVACCVLFVVCCSLFVGCAYFAVSCRVTLLDGRCMLVIVV